MFLGIYHFCVMEVIIKCWSECDGGSPDGGSWRPGKIQRRRGSSRGFQSRRDYADVFPCSFRHIFSVMMKPCLFKLQDVHYRYKNGKASRLPLDCSAHDNADNDTEETQSTEQVEKKEWSP